MADSTPLATTSFLRKTLLLLIVSGVLAALLYRSRDVIRLEGFSWERLGEAVRHARPLPLLLSVVGIYAAYALRALRWQRFSRYLGPQSFPSIYSSTLIGFTAIFLLGRAGEPIRPLLIARKGRLPVSSAFGIYVLERVFDLTSMAVIAGLSLLLLPRMPAGGGLLTTARTSGSLMLAGVLAAIAFLVYFRFHGAGALGRLLNDWHARPGWHARVAGLFAGFSEGLQAIRTLGDLLAGIAFSVVHWGVITAIYLLVPLSFGGRLAEFGFAAALLVLAFSMVGSTVMLPGVGGGSQAATFLAFTRVFGVETEPAAAASIVLWLATFAAVSLAGVPLLIREGWSMGELRRLARAEAEAEARGEHISVSSGAASQGEGRR